MQFTKYKALNLGEKICINNINYSLLSDSQNFLKIREKWNALLNETDMNNIYLTWEWFYNWWDVFKDNRKLFILIAEKDEKMIGIFPLVKRRIKYYNIVSYRRLEFLSTGELESEETCPCSMGIIAHPEDITKIYKGFFAYLTGYLRNEWDELLLLPLLKGMSNSKLFFSILKGSKDYFHEEKLIGKNIYTELCGSWDELLNSFGKKTRKKIRRGRKVLENMEKFSYDFLEPDGNLSNYFNSFVNLHRLRWKNGGAFSNKKFLKFQKNICHAFFVNGWLRISLMKVNNQIVSGNLDYQYGDTIYGYQTAFNPKFEPGLSIGLVGMTYCFEDAIKHNYWIYDWYRAGGENDYKNHFNPIERDVISIRYSKKSFKVLIFSLIKLIDNLLRKYKEKIMSLFQKINPAKIVSLCSRLSNTYKEGGFRLIVKLIWKKCFQTHKTIWYKRDLRQDVDEGELPSSFLIEKVSCEALFDYLKEKDYYIQEEVDVATREGHYWLKMSKQGITCGFYKIAMSGSVYIHDFKSVFPLPERCGFVVEMEVDEKFRGAGLGTLFKKRADAELKASGCDKVISFIPTWNIASIKSTVRCGRFPFKTLRHISLFGWNFYSTPVKKLLEGE